MFDAFLSDDGQHVIVQHEGKDEPEVMEIFEFTTLYGCDILTKSDIKPLSKSKKDNPEIMQKNIKHYWKAFRRVAELCGQYAHSTKLRQNAIDGVLEVQIVTQRYFGSDAGNKLATRIMALDSLRHTAVLTLDYWSQRVGYKPMSKDQDVEKFNLGRRSDTEILINHLTDPEFRKRVYYRIDKYSKKGELKSPAEIVLEVLKSFQKKPKKQPS